MSKKIKFIEVMKLKSDEELVKILTESRDDFVPAAIEAAEEEFAARKLDISILEPNLSKMKENAELIQSRSSVPLETHWKVLCVIFPGIIMLFISDYFGDNGYIQKRKEAIRFMLIGAAFWVLVAIGGTR